MRQLNLSEKPREAIGNEQRLDEIKVKE